MIRLLPADAQLAEGMRIETKGGKPNIGYWFNSADSVSWDLQAGRDGKFLVQIETATPHAGSVLLVQGIGKLACSVPKTENYETFQPVKVGEVTLSKDDKLTLTLHPVADGWHPVNVRKVELIPQP